MSQFEIITSQTSGVIEFNFEELKRNLLIAIEPYASMVVTEDTINEGKKTRANLNNLKKSINDKKIEVKKEFMKPYEEKENQFKELISIIDTGVSNLDGQVKTFEEIKKLEKSEAIKSYFDSLNFGLVPYEKLFDEKWLNVTVKDWDKQLISKIEKIQADLVLMESFNVEDVTLLKSLYLDVLDLTVAKVRYDGMQARKELVKATMPIQPQTPIETPVIVLESVITKEVEEILHRTFWVDGTHKQIVELGQYMNQNGITFGKVE